MAYEDEVYEGYDSIIGEEADEGGGYNVLPDGDYLFKVAAIEKQRHPGSDRIPPCPMVVLTLDVDGGESGQGRAWLRLYMAKKQSWKIKQFFVGVGLVDAEAKEFAPPWNQAVGATGACRLTQHTYNGRTSNDVERMLPPAEAAEVAARALAPQQAAPTPPWGA